MRLSKSDIEHCLYILGNVPNISATLWVSGIWLVITFLQYLIISVFHVGLAIALSIALAAFISMVLPALKQMGGNGTNSSGDRFSFLAFVLSTLVLLINIAGTYQIVQRWNNNHWNPYVVSGWAVLFIGIPVIHGTFQYIQSYRKLKRHSKRYISLNLTIRHYNELPIYVHKIQFINTETGASETYTDPKQNHTFYSWHDQQKADLITRIRHSTNELYTETIYIPVHANKFYLSWYSFAEDKYYSDEFVFKYDKFEPKKMKFPFHSIDTPLWGIETYSLDAITLYIKSKGRVDLYVKGWLRYFFWDVATVVLSDEQKQEFKRNIRYGMNSNESMDMLVQRMSEIQTSGRLDKRYDNQSKMFLWSLEVEGLGEITHHIDIEETEHRHFKRSAGALRTPATLCLPEKITIYKSYEDAYFYYYIYLDREKLYDCVTELTQEAEETPVHFHVHVINRMKKEMVITLKAKNQSRIFHDWQVETTGV